MDLVTHCCVNVCLVFCAWDGWGVGWLGWVLFVTFWVWCWGYCFLWNFLRPPDSRCLHGICNLNFVLFKFIYLFIYFSLNIFKIFLNQLYFYTFAFYVIQMFFLECGRVWWFNFVCFISPHQTQVQVNKNIIKTKKKKKLVPFLSVSDDLFQDT